ncbi:MAG: sodium-dependent transporter [Eubacteriales bacterium]|nr:sodium-dependent transporter [Eubacteriales bacterium]
MEKRGFVSKIGFIMSMAAFSIGIGNLWKFPYIVGNYGGGAFLLVYLLFLIFAGVPMFIVEVTLGRASGLSPISGMNKLEGKKSAWSIIGIVEAISILIIDGYATIIVGGWTLGYLAKVATGSLAGMDADALGTVFGAHTTSISCIVFTFLAYVLMWLCLNSGVKKGVEKICSILLPILMVILVGLAIYANTLPGAFEGLKWYVIPDFSKINLGVVSAALTQVFFSLGVGMCCAFVYGSYMDKDTNMTGSLMLTSFLDTGIAVLSGLICVPALFAFGIEPAAGPSLLFVTLPQLFNKMGAFGTVFGVLFFLCVFFAGFTSVLGGAESLVAVLDDGFKGLSRKAACIIVVVAAFLLSLVFISSFGNGPLSGFSCLGLGFFDFGDFIASGICLTLAAVLMLLYVILRWKFNNFMEAANEGAGDSKLRIYPWMKVYFNYILPIILLFACYCIIKVYI